MIRQPHELTTRQEIDEAIMYYRSTIAGCETAIANGEEYNFAGQDLHELISECTSKIQLLKEKRESIARPWEKARAPSEQSLVAYGVVV